MSREIIQEALNGIRDEYITEAGARLGLLAVGAASGAAVDPSALYSLSGTEAAVKTGFGAWLAKGGWIALVAGVVVAAGVAAGVFFFGKGGDVPPVGTGDVTTEEQEQSRFEEDVTTEEQEESRFEGDGSEKTTEGESETPSTEETAEPEVSRYLQVPLTDPNDPASYVSLPDLSAEGYPKLAFFTPVGEENTLREVFTLPISTKGEQNILVLLCEGIIDPSYQTGSSYFMLYFVESTFVEEVDGTEQRTVQMRCGRVDFYDTPMPVPSGDSVSYTHYHVDKTASASVTYSEANRDRVLASNRHNNLSVLDQADELLFEYGKETYELTVLYSSMNGVETVHTPVESLPDFPYELFRTHALP